jgi:hypothetical protein
MVVSPSIWLCLSGNKSLIDLSRVTEERLPIFTYQGLTTLTPKTLLARHYLGRIFGGHLSRFLHSQPSHPRT